MTTELTEPTGGTDLDAVLESITAPDTVDLPDPVDDKVKLLVPTEGADWVRVRELTGRDEETLSRAALERDEESFSTAVVKCGVVEGGKGSSTATADDVISDLALGDRDLVMTRIRELTFGPTIEVSVSCSQCRRTNDLEYNVNEPPIREHDPAKLSFTTPLGRVVKFRWATVSDQQEVLTTPKTIQEQNTEYLTRTVLTIDGLDPDPEWALDIRLQDRRALVRHITEHQPGPQYDEVEATCVCGNKLPVAVSSLSLFR